MEVPGLAVTEVSTGISFFNSRAPSEPLNSLEDAAVALTDIENHVSVRLGILGANFLSKRVTTGLDLSRHVYHTAVELDHPASKFPGETPGSGLVVWARTGHVRLFNLDLELLYNISDGADEIMCVAKRSRLAAILRS